MWTLRAIRLGLVLTPLVPAPAGYLICWLIAVGLAVGNASARRSVLRNLGVIRPSDGPLTRSRAMFRVFFTVVANYYDLARLSTVDRNRVRERVEVQGEEHLRDAVAAGRGVVVLAAHIGNFSVVSQLPTVICCEVALVHEIVEPRPLFEELTRLRSALGLRIIPADGRAALPIARLLRRGGVVILAGDRDVMRTGESATLFGRPARLPAGPVILARRTGATLLPTYSRRRSWRRSELCIGPPLVLQCSDDPEADRRTNLARAAGALEQMIATTPDQWAVLQAVWEECECDCEKPVSEIEPFNPARKRR